MDADISDDTDNFDEFYNMGSYPGQRNTKMEKFDQNVRKFHGDQFDNPNDYEYRGGNGQGPHTSEKAKLNRVSYKLIYNYFIVNLKNN